MTRYRVLLADDHRIVAEGLRGILEEQYDLVGIVEDGRDLVEQALQQGPDIIVVDITMPRLNGLDAIAQLRAAGCAAKVVFLTMHKDVTYATAALKVGALGYVLKHSASEDLLKAIQAAVAGQVYVSQEILNRMEQAHDTTSRAVGSPEITIRQREVLQLFAEGLSAKEVASALGISTRTAENHKARIMAQLGLSSSVELVQYAIRHGFLSTD
jgi:DNA-binding NarL/FixJ family response regulator